MPLYLDLRVTLILVINLSYIHELIDYYSRVAAIDVLYVATVPKILIQQPLFTAHLDSMLGAGRHWSLPALLKMSVNLRRGMNVNLRKGMNAGHINMAVPVL